MVDVIDDFENININVYVESQYENFFLYEIENPEPYYFTVEQNKVTATDILKGSNSYLRRTPPPEGFTEFDMKLQVNINSVEYDSRPDYNGGGMGIAMFCRNSSSTTVQTAKYNTGQGGNSDGICLYLNTYTQTTPPLMRHIILLRDFQRAQSWGTTYWQWDNADATNPFTLGVDYYFRLLRPSATSIIFEVYDQPQYELGGTPIKSVTFTGMDSAPYNFFLTPFSFGTGAGADAYKASGYVKNCMLNPGVE